MKQRIVIQQSENGWYWAEFQVYERKRYRIKEHTNGTSPAHAVSRLKMTFEPNATLPKMKR